jgi:hypothetical protein
MRLVHLCVIVAACGGSITTVDGSKSTGSLSPSDQNQLCTDIYNYTLANVSTSDELKLSCGFEAMNQPSCTQFYATCTSQSVGAFDAGVQGTPDCTAFNAQVAKCNTTVAEYTKCLEEEINALKSLESQMPLCDQASAVKAELTAYGSLSADCIQLAQTCQFTTVPSSGGNSGGNDAGTD